jgi:hypothetical protein
MTGADISAAAAVEDAARFLAHLGSDEAYTFQIFGEAPRVKGTFARVLHGSFHEKEIELRCENERGAGVFVMVNAGDGIVKPGSKTCRTAANVVCVRALFLDLDGAPIQPVLDAQMQPDWIVESSPEHWHAYWRVEDCALWDFEVLQSALAAKFGGDPAVKDLSRVMRIPGFVHRKRDPFVSRLYVPSQSETLQGRFHHA